MTLVALATEDALSEAVGKRLLIDAGYQLNPSPLLRRNGSGYLRSKMDSWCEMAKRKPVFLLIDLDRTVCPAELRAAWIGNRKPPENLVMRVAVREIEAWILADHQALKTIVGSRGSFPVDPDSLPDPKQYFLRLVARQARREIREELVAGAGAIASQGIGYNALLGHLVSTVWSPERAAHRSKSLHKARIRLRELVHRMPQNQD